ncbi:hypothetical protein [Snodgrassella communis]|uniref:hypothetical protein n=1 Tax=Snodgrassella communis TaxID=2946699 RepID=UPI001EF4F661|nr:hypothetical protein [Snodgrassella communis]
MLKYSKKGLLILFLIIQNSIFAKNFDIKEQQKFFCQLEKFDQCFYTGKCSLKELKNYTDYFDKITEHSYYWINKIYDRIPQILVKNNDLKLNEKVLTYNSVRVFYLSGAYIDGKYSWLTWFKHKTGISYEFPQNIFTKNESQQCGEKMFDKYLSLPLPEDADLLTCIIHYEFISPSCLPRDKELEEKLFCNRGGLNCQIEK